MAKSAAAKKTDPAPAAAPTAEKEKKFRLRNFKPDQVIKVLAEKNPKRAGSATAGRFELYENGMTVEAALAAGITTADLDYDNKKGFISIT
jgi:hypothetical protein